MNITFQGYTHFLGRERGGGGGVLPPCTKNHQLSNFCSHFSLLLFFYCSSADFFSIGALFPIQPNKKSATYRHVENSDGQTTDTLHSSLPTLHPAPRVCFFSTALLSCLQVPISNPRPTHADVFVNSQRGAVGVVVEGGASGDERKRTGSLVGVGEGSGQSAKAAEDSVPHGEALPLWQLPPCMMMPFCFCFFLLGTKKLEKGETVALAVRCEAIRVYYMPLV